MFSKLHEVVISCGSKRLSKVDLPHSGSRQHEIGIPKKCNHIFRSYRTGSVIAEFVFLGESNLRIEKFIEVFYYNVRQGKNRSPEYRLYYPLSLDSCFDGFYPGDLCIFIEDINHDLRIIVVSQANLQFKELNSLFSDPFDNQLQLYDRGISDRLREQLSFKKTYPLYNLSSFEHHILETVGTKAIAWYFPKENKNILFLFKKPKPERESGEGWAEKIAFELAVLLELPAAKTDLCRDKDQALGCLSKSFIPKLTKYGPRKRTAFQEFRASEFTMGNQIMYAHLGQEYSEHKKTRFNPLYELKNIQQALLSYDVGSLWPQLLEYFYFDAFIGNRDRHHENWGIIQFTGFSGEKAHRELAPTFDHGPSFDSGNNDSKRSAILGQNRMRSQYEKGNTVIHTADGKRATLPELVLECLKRDKPDESGLTIGQKFAKKLKKLERSNFQTIMSHLPDNIMSEITREYVIEYLVTSKQVVLELIPDEL